jgi:hypothetical protein
MKTTVKIVFMMFVGMVGSAIILFNGIFAQDSEQMLKLSLIGLSCLLISVITGSAALKHVTAAQDEWRIK